MKWDFGACHSAQRARELSNNFRFRREIQYAVWCGFPPLRRLPSVSIIRFTGCRHSILCAPLCIYLKIFPVPFFSCLFCQFFFLFCANFNAITTRYCWVLSTLYNYVEISRVMELLVVVKAFIYNFSIGKTLRFPSTSTETSQASAVIYYLLSKL